jgi:hypothetical protein
MPFRILLLLAALNISLSLYGQQPAPAAPTPPLNPVQKVINDQFGDGFTLDASFAPMTADFDADGTEDLALVVVAKNPLANSVEKNFKVVDPYDAYFGFGDPKVTTKFSDFGDGNFRCVLIMHDWRAGAPKLKFVLVNLPFEKLELSKMPLKKKTVPAISATELGGLNSLVYWDGKKYKWEPTEFSNDTKNLSVK